MYEPQIRTDELLVEIEQYSSELTAAAEEIAGYRKIIKVMNDEIKAAAERERALVGLLKNVHKHYQDQCNHILKPLGAGKGVIDGRATTVL